MSDVLGPEVLWLDLVAENALWSSAACAAQGGFAIDVAGVTPQPH